MPAREPGNLSKGRLPFSPPATVTPAPARWSPTVRELSPHPVVPRCRFVPGDCLIINSTQTAAGLYLKSYGRYILVTVSPRLLFNAQKGFVTVSRALCPPYSRSRWMVTVFALFAQHCSSSVLL